MRLGESVPLGERKPAGVNAACHGGQTGWTEVGSSGCFWNLIKEHQNRPCLVVSTGFKGR